MNSSRLSLLFVLLSAFLVLLGGCESVDYQARKAEQARKEAEDSRLRAAFLARIHEAESDVWAILDPLIQKAAHYREEETFGYIGAVFATEAFYSEALLKEVRAEGFGSHVSVFTVFDDSPAAKAGLQGGDRLLSVNGVRVPRGQSSGAFATRKIKRLLIPGEMNQLEVQRGEEVLEFDIEAIPATYYSVIVVASNSVDLHVDGDVIWLGLSIVESMDDSDDLAHLCAYALAKNVMRHSRQKGRNAFLGQLVDIAAMTGGVNTGGVFQSMGGSAHEQAFEVESDLVALYLLASAGYRFDAYPDFWDKVLRARSKKGALKPKDEDRLEKMRSVIASIEAKQAAGEPVFPEEYLQGDVSELEAAQP